MNNSTIEEIKIKKRGDNVYDVYFNGDWVASRGSYIGAFAAVMEYIDFLNGTVN